MWSLLLLGVAALLISAAGVVRDTAMTVGLACAGTALLAVFLVVDRRVSASVLPPSVFGPGPLKWVYATLGVLMAGTMVDMYVPLFGQRLAHLTPVAAGFLGAGLAVGWTVAEISSASLSRDRMIRRVTAIAPVVMAAGLTLNALTQRQDASAGYVAVWALGLVMSGVGVGMAWPHLSAWAMSKVGDPGEGRSRRLPSTPCNSCRQPSAPRSLESSSIPSTVVTRQQRALCSRRSRCSSRWGRWPRSGAAATLILRGAAPRSSDCRRGRGGRALIETSMGGLTEGEPRSPRRTTTAPGTGTKPWQPGARLGEAWPMMAGQRQEGGRSGDPALSGSGHRDGGGSDAVAEGLGHHARVVRGGGGGLSGVVRVPHRGAQARHGPQVAYGIWGACGVALTATLSTLIYREAFTVGMGIGLVCVIAGVLLVETGSRAEEPEPRAGAADR